MKEPSNRNPLEGVGKYLLPLGFLLLIPFFLRAQPIANFSATPNSGCSPLVVNFTDLSTGSPSFWEWDFGNANTSNLQNPSAIYTTPGNYTVTLVVGDGISFDTLVMTNLITVFANPTADFTNGPATGCQPWQVQFNDLSQPGSGVIAAWLWDFGDGNVSTQVNPIHTYQTAGTFTVSLQVTDVNGCSNTLSIPNVATIWPKPVAGFSASPRGACNPPLNVTFSNSSAQAVSWNWDFGDGSPASSLQNPQHTYTQPGSYTVTLEVTSANGCKDTLIQPNYIVISGSNAGFNVNPGPYCEGDTLVFADTTRPRPVNWSWTFGNGAIDSVRSPAIGFDSVGSFDVTMAIQYANGCRDTVRRPGFITIQPYARASFSGDTTSRCFAPHTVNFTNLVEPGISYSWDFGDNSTGTGSNPSHTYTSPGLYSVTLIAQSPSGCNDTLVLQQYIRIGEPLLSINANPFLGCAPLEVAVSPQVSFTTSPMVSYQWNFGNGTTSTQAVDTVTYTSGGTYVITLIGINAEGCSDTVQRQILVGQRPAAAFTAFPNPACASQSVTFTDSSQNATSWFWEFGDGNFGSGPNVAHTYQDTGRFVVTLIANNNGCRDTITDTVEILPPIALFSWRPDPVCNIGDTITFTNGSIGADSIFWDFGNGFTSNAQQPTWVTTSAGILTITLYAYNFTTGCADTLIQTVTITQPEADFAAQDTAGCIPHTVVFADSSDPAAIAWSWDFGDGTTSIQQNPTHTYTRPGNYTVSLTIRTQWGCVVTTSKPAYVQAWGIAGSFAAIPDTACLSDSVFFQNTSLYYDTITTRIWDFGDGNSSNLESPYHQYGSPGSYLVTLIQADSMGCTDTVSNPVFVSPSVIGIQVDSIHCIGDTVDFLNTSTSANAFLWQFGDGDTSTAYSPSHYYDTLGTYPMVFSAADTLGCSDTIRQNIYIVDPLANFSASPTSGQCPPMLVQFSDGSSWDVNGWYWDFGDGSFSTLQNPAHNYTQPGVYDVTLIVTSAGGCKDTIFFPALISLSGPSGSFTVSPRSGCFPLEPVFQATTQNATQLIWDFGDGTLLNGPDSLAHFYSSPGVYHPVLLIEDSSGCRVTYQQDSVEVFPLPQAAFSVSLDSVCGSNLAVQFSDQSVAASQITSWQWDFGDGTVSSLQNPVHTYASTGTYPVTLIVTTIDGCGDTLVRPGAVNVFPTPIAQYTDSIPSGPGPKPVFLNDSSLSASPLVYWQWNMGDGSVLQGQQISHTYSTCGIYPVQLIIEDQNGCRDTTQGLLDPYPYPQVDAGQPVAFCEGDSGAQLQAVLTQPGSSPHYFTWWCDSSYTFCGLDSVFDDDPVALPDSSTWYFVQVHDNVGCPSNIDSVWVEVLPRPIVDAGPDVFICPDSAPGAFLNPVITGAPGPYTYQWIPGSGLNDSTVLNPYARPDTTTIYTLIATGANGCSSDRTTVDTLSSAVVTVRPQPIADAGPDRHICLHDSIRLTGLGYGAGPQYSFEWSPYTGLTDTSVSNPVASPPATTEYILTVWSNGCPGSDTVVVNVHALPTANPGNTTDICLGESTTLNGFAWGDSTATYSYSWTPAASLNNSQIQNPVATPDTTTTYSLIATSNYGCQSPVTEVLIVVKPTPVAEAGPQQIFCGGDSVQLTGGYTYTTTPPADSSQVYFQWTPAAGLLSDSTARDPWVAPTGSQFYYLTVLHNTCSTTDSVLVSLLPEIGGWANADTTVICEGDTVYLSGGGGQGGADFSWEPASLIQDPFLANTSAQPDSTTLFTLTIAESGCEEVYEVPVRVIPAPDIEILSSSPTGCAPLTVHFLDDSKDLIFRTWYFGDGTISNDPQPVHTFGSPGTYDISLSGVNSGGCRSVDTSLTITVASPGNADFTSSPAPPVEIPLPGEEIIFTDQSTGAVTWAWEFGDGTFSGAAFPAHRYNEAGEYYVTLGIVTAEGCRSSVTKGPYIVFPPELFIPNVFTPNNDGLQDRFGVDYDGNEPFLLQIFDRWGALLFETRNHLDKWKGTNSAGERVPEGVYYYVIEVGGRKYSGDLTLLR